MDLTAIPPRGAARDLVGLDQHHIGTGRGQVQGGRQTSEPATDDADVGAARTCQRRVLRHALDLQPEEGGGQGTRHQSISWIKESKP